MPAVPPGGRAGQGRLAGDVRPADSRATRPFEGIIELVGLIEVFLADPSSVPGITGADTLNPSGTAG